MAWGEWVLVGSYKTEYQADSHILKSKKYNHEVNSRNDYGIVALRWEKRHEVLIPAHSELHRKLQTSEPPDYEAIAHRVRNKLKIGEQSAGGKVIKEYIKELKKETQ